jgi:hypothetical protein
MLPDQYFMPFFKSNAVEGLRHSGVAGVQRRIFSDFGSSWRGLAAALKRTNFFPSFKAIQTAGQLTLNNYESKIISNLFHSISENTAATLGSPKGLDVLSLELRAMSSKSITPSTMSRIQRTAPQVHSRLTTLMSYRRYQPVSAITNSQEAYKKLHDNLVNLRSWSKSTGLAPILKAPSSPKGIETLTRHEAIHQAQLSSFNNPAIRDLLEKTPSLERTYMKLRLKGHARGDILNALKQVKINTGSTFSFRKIMKEELYKRYGYTLGNASIAHSGNISESGSGIVRTKLNEARSKIMERLAYGNQDKRGIIDMLGNSGVKTYKTETKRLVSEYKVRHAKLPTGIPTIQYGAETTPSRYTSRAL